MPPHKYTKLFKCIYDNKYQALEQVLTTTNIDPNTTNEVGLTPTHVACMLNHWKCLEVLINDSRTVLTLHAPDGRTPYDCALAEHSHQCVALLASIPGISDTTAITL